MKQLLDPELSLEKPVSLPLPPAGWSVHHKLANSEAYRVDCSLACIFFSAMGISVDWSRSSHRLQACEGTMSYLVRIW